MSSKKEIGSAFLELIAEGFINNSAPAGEPNGREEMWRGLETVLRPALKDSRVIIHDQIAEADRVTTRKTITAVHAGTLHGIPATHKSVAVDVIEIVRIENGQIVEHWGLNTMSQMMTALRGE